MNITIKKGLAKSIGYDKLEMFGMDEKRWESSYADKMSLDLARLDGDKIDALEVILERATDAGLRGAGPLLHDLNAWTRAIEGEVSKLKPRSLKQFELFLRQFILEQPGHRLYKRHDDQSILCYYVEKVNYELGYKDNPPIVVMTLAYEEFGNVHKIQKSWHGSQVAGVFVSSTLADAGYMTETPELRAGYLETIKRWAGVASEIGKQFWARGWALSLDENRDYWRHSSQTQLDRYGEASRVVIDVFSEDGQNPNSRSGNFVDRFFWVNIAKRHDYDPDKEESWIGEEDTLERPDVEVPIHPWLAVFHLQKHLRVKAHIDQMEEYMYDDRLADKLVLPLVQKNLIKLLIDSQGGYFQDIVRGKGGGAVVLLSGPPGTGKTLTAEVYAESEHRPLYSIQCSQLGLTPETLEKSLMVCFDRARRWNAVMLLDEADVYVHERGTSMTQNAIVGVFLRVLEYQNTVLFLTTNRPDDVDDAIASRCIARLSYKPPTQADALLIWKTLAANAGLNIDEFGVQDFIAESDLMSGRDIKTILKLAALADGADKEITKDMLEFAQQFKPT